jgi:hypothetical protein
VEVQSTTVFVIKSQCFYYAPAFFSKYFGVVICTMNFQITETAVKSDMVPFVVTVRNTSRSTVTSSAYIPVFLYSATLPGVSYLTSSSKRRVAQSALGAR